MENGKKNSLRLALMASEHTLSEYSMFLERLLLGLADESIPVALVFPPNSDMDSVIFPAVEVIRYPAIELPLAERLGRKTLAARLAEFKPTVLHCLCESKAPLTRWLARQLDLPYVSMVNSLTKQWRHFSISLKHCAKITVPAKSIEANLAEAYPRLAERIRLINIGTFVTQDSVCFSEPSRIATMVLAHPLDNADDFENVFSAVRRMMVDGYEFAMVVMGDGRAESQLRKLLSAFDLLQTVTIIPRLRPCRSVLAAGDIFIQPRPSHHFNRLLLEAMSVGAAVAGCKGGVDDLIIEDRTAVVFDPDDEHSIINTLQRLLGKREFARKIAQNAQQYLRENHSVSEMVSATLQTCHEARQWYER